ncbi:MAG: diphthine synthase [Candidatus Nanohaloarchaea archaeon]
MLHIVGLGLDDGEITGKGVQAVENAEKVFAEFYTNTQTVDLERLEEETGKQIQKLERSKVEREDRIIESAEKQETAFLVSGDPLTATTHYDIKHRAEEEGIETRIVHAPSILTSVNETGLNVYKFGRTVTLPREGRPDSVVEHIEKNDSVGLHTLVLLDINYTADLAAEKLAEMSGELGGREVLVVERANSETQEITRTRMEDVTGLELGEPPHCLVLVGETSHKEEEFLEGH